LEHIKGLILGKITQSDKNRIEALGFIKEQRSSTEETLDILEQLKEEGVDVTKIQMKSTRETGKERSTYLYEIQYEKIEEIIEKLGLDRNYPIGFKMSRMLQAYRGTGTGKITESDRKRIEVLGIIREKTVIEETLEILVKLETEGIDISGIKKTIGDNGKRRHIYLHEIQNEDIEEIIKKLEIDRMFPLGKKMNDIIQAYNGTNNMKIPDECIKIIESLGLVSELKKKEAEQGRLKKKQQRTRELKAKVQYELNKKKELDIGDNSE